MLGIATELALPAKKSACLVQNLLDHFEILLLMWRKALLRSKCGARSDFDGVLLGALTEEGS